MIRFDASDRTVLVLCCRGVWRELVVGTLEQAETIAVAHLWEAHDQDTANRLTSTIYRRQQRRRQTARRVT